MNYIYGPIPSRRLGRSLGISPIPEKTCNYSCVFCQLGRIRNMGNTRKMFYPVKDIVKDFLDYQSLAKDEFDAVSIVGDGEPTLYLGLGELIIELKKHTDKPIAVITNGALLYDADVRKELLNADVVLPTIVAADEEIYKKINRPVGVLNYEEVFHGLEVFSKEYKGQLWLELILVGGVNDSTEYLNKIKAKIKNIRYDKIYVNTAVRPPAEDYVEKSTHEAIIEAVKIFKAISIEELVDGNYYSELEDNFESILNISQRHPMTNFEITSFLEARGEKDIPAIFKRLEADKRVYVAKFNGISTYRVDDYRV